MTFRSGFIILFTTLVTFSCSTGELPQRDYYGELQLNGHTLRLLFSYNDAAPSLFIIGFRGEQIPIKNVAFEYDTLRFNRADMFQDRFNGYYDTETGRITGKWTTDSNVAYPITFTPVLSDTIIGLHPRTTSAYEYAAPSQGNDGISVCSLETACLNAGTMDSLMRAVIKKKFGYIHGILIARRNCLALEEYFYGFKRESLFGIQSATKSMVSALTGIALDRREIPDVHVPFCQYMPTYRDLLCNDQNKSITLHDALSMTTGLAWDEVTHIYGDERNSAVIASQHPDEIRYLLSQPRTGAKVFAYNSLNHAMVSHVLMEATDTDNVTEFKQRLLGPLGITEYDLGEPGNGIIGDISLRPRDMLKFGLLYYNNGIWNDRQVVPSAWVQESTSPKIILEPGFGYGYFWWTKQFSWKQKIVDSYFAWGFGGQYIFVVPELDLVVVFIGTNWSTDPKEVYFEIMEKYIVRACD